VVAVQALLEEPEVVLSRVMVVLVLPTQLLAHLQLMEAVVALALMVLVVQEVLAAAATGPVLQMVQMEQPILEVVVADVDT
jgi:hypothetical protein